MNSQTSRIRQKLTFIGKIVICTLMASLSFSESHAQRKLINKEIPVSSSKLKFIGEQFGMTNRKTITGHSDDWLLQCDYQFWKGAQKFLHMQMCYLNLFNWFYQQQPVQKVLSSYKWIKPAIWADIDDRELTIERGNYQYRNFSRSDYRCVGFYMNFGVNGETGQPDRRIRGFYCQKNKPLNDKFVESVFKSIGYKHERFGFEAIKPSPIVTAKKTPTVTTEKTPATKKSSTTVSNDWQSVSLAASWESKDNLLAGVLKYKNNGGKGLIEASAGSISCKGTWQFVSGKYGTSNLPIGTWAIACNDGSAASGTYQSDKLGKGTGRGTDADGKTVKLTFGLN